MDAPPHRDLLRARDNELLSRLGVSGALRDHIYVVDPLGNEMLRYPREADASSMRRDITRLLEVARID